MEEREYNTKFLLAMGILLNSYEFVVRSLESSIGIFKEINKSDYNKSLSTEDQAELFNLMSRTNMVKMTRKFEEATARLIFIKMLEEMMIDNTNFLSECYDDLLTLSVEDKTLSAVEQSGITFCMMEIRKLQSISSSN